MPDNNCKCGEGIAKKKGRQYWEGGEWGWVVGGYKVRNIGMRERKNKIAWIAIAIQM